MNTKNHLDMQRWYNNQSFSKKIVIIYLLCAAIPMILVTAYNYSQTKSILIDRAYQDMQQSVDTLENNINLLLQPYEIITRTIEGDRTMNLLLNTDYRDQSYSELVYYCHKEMDHLRALFPSTCGTSGAGG